MSFTEKSMSLKEMPLLNGRFDDWRDGTSITTANIIGVVHALVDLGTNGAGTFSRQTFTMGQTAVPGEPIYFMRLNWTTAPTAGAPEFHSKIEDVRTFQGQKVCIQGFCRTNQAFTIGIQQNYGSGGSPTADVNTTAGTVPSVLDSTGAVTWRPFAVFVTIPLLGAATIGSTVGTDYLAIRYLPTLNVLSQIDLADVRIHVGGERMPGAYARPIYEEARLLDRWYGALTAYAPVSTQTSNWVPFATKMVRVPTMSGGTGSTLGTATVDGFPIISTGAAGAITAIVADARIAS